jgi:hypothetical protein
MTHKYGIGQTVWYSPARSYGRPRGEYFKVVRLLPETGNIFQYRVKSQTDGHERVVREDQLFRTSL